MWKFKVSKFKNTVPKVPKREEWISDLPVTLGYQSSGNHVAASSAFMAFNVDNAGSLGVLPVQTKGRQSMGMPLLHCHGDFVTDFEFSPHDDHLLCTGSQDCTVRLWRIPEGGIDQTPCNPEFTMPTEGRRVENVHWHPTAEGVMGVTSHQTLKVFDVANQQPIYVGDSHGDQIQSFSWHGDGSTIVTSCKDKTLRLIDPRANTVTQETKGHANIRDSRVLWLGDSPFIVSTGFDSSRSRELRLWDNRNFTTAVKSMTFDISTGILMPLFDPDTNMLFLAGKGDTTIAFLETTDKSPYITEASSAMVEQMKGIAMVPKRAVDVLNAEVNRLLVLTKNAVIPVPYQVPRKSYNEYYPELFPDTDCGQPAMTAEQWVGGQNDMPDKVSLDPTKKGRITPLKKPQITNKPTTTAASASESNIAQPAATHTYTPPQKASSTPSAPAANGTSTPKSTPPPEPPAPRVKPTPHKMFAGVHHPKFRHLKATVMHRDTHIENIRNLSKTMPGESDFFQVNRERAALPLAGSGGLISVLELSNVGKLPDTGVPALQNSCMVMDFEWDPFNNHRLAVAGDDAKIQLWRIPEGGLTDTLTTPEACLRGHQEKIYFVRFHPMASDILATASYDMTVRIWDLTTGSDVITLEGHTDTIFCLSWSPDGKKLATVCKDGKIRVYDPRKSTQPISEGPGPVGSRGARVVWACGGMFLAVSGFDRQSQRCIQVYEPLDLSAPVAQHDIDRTPAILVPFYDEDSSTVFLTGRGDSIVYAFEIHEEAPYLYQLSTYNASGLHQALSFLPKNACDVAKVEFARAYRLKTTSLEPVSFTVPRVRSEFFQDDLFPETRVTWEAALTSSEWLDGVNRLQDTISLQPSHMTSLSDAPVEAPKPKKYESHTELTTKTSKQKSDELVGAMVSKLGIHDEPLPQDLTEGVDEDEWSD